MNTIPSMRLLIFTFFLFFSFSISFAKLVGDREFNPKVTPPTFAVNHPLICFDQGHLNYKPGDGRYDPVFKLLESDGYKIELIKTAISEKTLEKCQIFFVSAAMAKDKSDSAFSPTEIERIKAWVSDGASLLLMTDHPKDLAQGPELLANAFGVFGSLQTVEDPVQTVAALNDPTVIVFSENEMKGDSPIFQGRNEKEHLHKVVAFTGQSLHGPTQSESILFLSKTSVQSPGKDQPKTVATGRSMMLALKFGRGRVIVTGDGTFFSSKVENEKNEKYGINRPGTDNVQLALNTFHWLSKVLN